MTDNIIDDFEKSAVLLKILETGIEIGTKFEDKKLLDDAAGISKGITREYYKTLAKNALLKKKELTKKTGFILAHLKVLQQSGQAPILQFFLLLFEYSSYLSN